ncbi:aryl-sulfate sulfotransferase [Calditrichota bacterium]
MRKVVLLLFALTLIFSFSDSIADQPITPASLDTLNYTHVVFQWPAMNGAMSYHLQVAEDEDYDPFIVALVHEQDVTTNAVEVTTGLQWGWTYIWRVFSLDGDGNSIDTSYTYQFSIEELNDTLWTVTTETFNAEEVQPGVTIFGMRRRGVLAASDMEGNCIWMLPGADSELDLLSNGNMLYGAGGAVIESDLAGNEVFHSENVGNHHESDKLPNGNYLSLSRSYMEVDDPFIEDSSMIWRGDILIELDSDGDTVWTWNTFDHFSTEDFDTAIFLDSRGGSDFDWTHGNTAHMTPDGKFIYMNFRHLSRITMISYPDGDIIWNLGLMYASGEAAHGANVNFNEQHDPELLDNGNFIMYDNHTLGPEDSSRAVEISVDFDRDPVVMNEWDYWVDTLSGSGGDADRLANGNTLITSTRLNTIIEVTREKEEVWRMTDNWDNSFGAYRSDRVPGLHPLIYTVKAPDEMAHVPAGESYFTVVVNNIGWADQNYVLEVTDTEAWFQTDQAFMVEAEGMGVRTVLGMADEGVANDTVTVVVYPVNNPDQRDVSVFVIQSDPELSVEGITIRPVDFTLQGVYPNPFNSTTTINFTLPTNLNTSLEIFDITGKRVKTLYQGNLNAGFHRLSWGGDTELGSLVPTGTYIYKLQTQAGTKAGQIQLVK